MEEKKAEGGVEAPITTNHELFEELKKAQAMLLEKVGPADVAMVLGSGLSAISEGFEDVKKLSFNEIPLLPMSTVAGHAGELINGKYKDMRILIWAGRVHRYEGFTRYETNIIPLLSLSLGCQYLINTNAAGGMIKGMKLPCIMMIHDHLNLTGPNPLRTLMHEPRLFSGYFDSEDCYSEQKFEMGRKAAKETGFEMDINAPDKENVTKFYEGVYTWNPGPCYETIVETEILYNLGANAVGMSTVPEIMTSNGIGIQNLNFSMITNLASFLCNYELNHIEVQENAKLLVPKMREMLLKLIDQITINPEKGEINRSKFGSLEDREELPLPAMKHLKIYGEFDINEEVTVIKGLLSEKKLIGNLEFGVILLNGGIYENILEDKVELELCKMKGFRVLSKFGKVGKLVVGRMSGRLILFVIGEGCCDACELEGAYLAQLLSMLGLKVILTVLTAKENIPSGLDHNTILPIEDYYRKVNGGLCNYTQYSHTYNYSVHLALKDLLEKKLGGDGSKHLCLSQFDPPALPSHIDKEFSMKQGMELYTINSMAAISNLQAFGVYTPILAHLAEFKDYKMDAAVFESISKLLTSTTFIQDGINIVNGESEFNIGVIKEMEGAVMEGRNMTKDLPKITLNLPFHNDTEVLKNNAAKMMEFFGIEVDTCIICSGPFTSFVGKCGAIITKCVVFVGDYRHMQPLPTVYLCRIGDKHFLLLDEIMVNEENHFEAFPAIICRILMLSGAKDIVIVAEVTSDGQLETGAKVILTDFMPMYDISPLTGPNPSEKQSPDQEAIKWGERFPPVSTVLTKPAMDPLKKVFLDAGAKEVKACQMSSVKLLCGLAEERIARSIGLEVIAKKGIGQAQVVHHHTLGGTHNLLFVGVVERKATQPKANFQGLLKAGEEAIALILNYLKK